MGSDIRVLIYKKFWTCDTAKEHPEHLFVFGDNDIGKGCGGQAILRYEPNAIGIPTKKYPSMDEDSFYTDDEYEENVIKIDTAIKHIKTKLEAGEYKYLVLPKNGFGTGLAKLDKYAPETLKYINKKVDALITRYNC